jgi:hypothetical protein
MRRLQPNEDLREMTEGIQVQGVREGKIGEPSIHDLLIVVRLTICMVYFTSMHHWAVFERHFVSSRPCCDVFCAVRSLLQ